MSSSLTVPLRADVDIGPFSARDTRNDVVAGLWEELLRTSADASQSPSQSFRQWAESCVYVARVLKSAHPAPSRQEDPTVSASCDDSQAWGHLEWSWMAPATTLGPRNTSLKQSSPQDLFYINTDFKTRVVNLPDNLHDPGPLHEYASLCLVQEDGQEFCHAYLYDSVLIFVIDPENISPVSTEDHRTSPLDVVGVVYIHDIHLIYHMFKRIGDYPAFALTLTVLTMDSERRTVSLIFPTAQSLWNWSTALRWRMTGSRSAQDALDTDLLVKGMVAVDHWPFDAVPLHKYGVLQKYSPVAIKSGGTLAQVGAYLFAGDHLVFMYTTNQDDLIILRDIFLADVFYVSNDAHNIVLTVEGSDKQHIDLRFRFDSIATAYAWRKILLLRIQSLRPHPVIPPRDVSSKLTWHFAGIVSLSVSADTEKEYNISLAIEPGYQGDGLATQAVAHALDVAFKSFGAHRVQARVLHGAATTMQGAVSRFLHWGFTHEGTRRRAVYAKDGSYMDMTVLSLLDTEWALRETKHPPKHTSWDELFVRHQRERDALLIAAGNRTQQSKAPGPTPSETSDVEGSEGESFVGPQSELSDGVPLSTLSVSRATVPVPGINDDAESNTDQIRRWIEQQALDPYVSESFGTQDRPQ